MTRMVMDGEPVILDLIQNLGWVICRNQDLEDLQDWDDAVHCWSGTITTAHLDCGSS